MKLALLLSLAVGVSAQFKGIVKANEEQTDSFQLCAAQGTAPGAGLFLGPCKVTTNKAFDTYGYLSIKPTNFGMMPSRSAKVYNANPSQNKGVNFKDVSGFSKGKVTKSDDLSFAYITAGGFVGEVSGLQDAGQPKQGGFIGSSTYIVTKGSVSGVESNLFRLGEKSGKVHYMDVPLPKKQSYKDGDLKFNIYSWINPKTEMLPYFGIRYRLQYSKGKTDEIKEPLFKVGGNWVTLKNGESLDNVEKIQFTTKQCITDKKYCFILDNTAVDVRYGVGPEGCTDRAPLQSDSALIPDDEIAKSLIMPKECFLKKTDEFANKQLQVNIQRVSMTELEIDYTFVTDEFRGFDRKGVNYLIFDPKGEMGYNEAGADAASDSGVVATTSAVALATATAFLY